MKLALVNLAALLGLVTACSSDKAGDAAGGGGGQGGAQAAETPLYALAILVFGPDTTTTYVSVFDSLDIDEIDTKKAYEFAGTSDILPYDGKLFINDGESPIIRRYAVGTKGELTEDGEISFANLGYTDVGVRDNIFISPTKAYLATPENDGYQIWNPTTMKLGGKVVVPDMDRGDDNIIDGSYPVLRGDKLYRTYYWEDWSTYSFSAEQYVAIFDTKNDKFLGKTREERCPNLGAAAQQDAAGNIYFSNWFYNIPGTLMKDAPKSCALRIKAGEDIIDPDWSLTFSDIADGHEGAQLSLVNDGKAVFSVFHQEDFTITKDTAPYEIPSSTNWEAWELDLAEPTKAHAISGMDRGVSTQTVFNVDGRSFILAPGTDWVKTNVYEVMADGKGRLAFEIDGWSRGFFKIR